ncbi:flagellar filament capping protein FliD [Jatrophihabitans fulvus]
MATGSISVTGLLGGTAGKIDVPSLISSLMQAQSVPQNLLKDQLSSVNDKLTAYQSINTRLAAVQTAARALTGATSAAVWQAGTASSSSPSVSATAGPGSAVGSTTFDVVRLAAAQVSTVQPAADGTVVSDPDAGIVVVSGDGTAHQIDLTSGSASSVASAINSAGVGVRAAVVQTDQGPVLQLSSARSGAANGFSVMGLDTAPQQLVAASDAQVRVGGASGYTVSSSSNTFTGVIPGVSFSVGAVANDVSVSVTQNTSAISDAVKALVTATNAARTELGGWSGKGGLLQGAGDVRSTLTSLGSLVSRGTGSGGSLAQYGITVDKTFAIAFDADVFAKAYAADPDATQAAIAGSFAAQADVVSTAAIDTTTGSISQTITGLQGTGSRLSKEIDGWTAKLADIKDALTAKYTTMQTALARLQSQQTYLTSMFNSMNGSQDASS